MRLWVGRVAIGSGMVFGLLLRGVLPPPMEALVKPESAVVELDANLGMETLPLYPGRAPGARGDGDADTPTLTIFRPTHSNGTAMIVAPGGGYVHLAGIQEGREPADRLTSLGVTVFVLKYRIGPAYLYPVPLEDARRAVRLVRSLASKYGYAPDRIGMMGFSAGGHLTAMTGLMPEPGKPGDADPVEHESSKLDFMVLAYPWLNAMQPQVPDASRGGNLMINYCSVTKGLTQKNCQKLDPQYTPVAHVTASTPPAFLVQTADDHTVPVTTSVEFFTAMHKAGADAEMHIFEHGPHGFGPGLEHPELAPWQDLLANWLRSHGWLTPASHAANQ